MCCLIYLNGQDYPAKLIGEINRDFYIWESRCEKPEKLNSTYDHSLLRFDSSMKLITSIKLGRSPSQLRPVLFDEEQVEQVMMIGNRIVLLTLTSDSREEKQTLYYQFIDPLTLAKRGQKIKLIESHFLKGRIFKTSLFTYCLSDDGARLMITTEYPLKAFKATPKYISINVYDENLNLLWTRSETLTVTDKQFTPAFYQVDNSGDVAILATTKYDKDTVESKLLTNYLLLEYTEKGQKFSAQNLPLEVADFKIIGSHILYSGDKISAAGFFKIPKVRKQYGYFLQEYNLENLKREKNYYKTLAQEAETENEADVDPELKKLDKVGGDDRFAFIIKKMRHDEYGNIFLIGEQNNTYYNISNNVRTITEYYLDIYVLKLDPEGKLIWEIRIPKKQVYKPTGFKNVRYLKNFVSYGTTLLNGNLLFFINDNPENLDIKNAKPRSVNWKESQGQVVIVNKDGKMQRKLITGIPGNMFYTGFIYGLSGNRILIRYAAFKEYEESFFKIIDLDQILSD